MTTNLGVEVSLVFGGDELDLNDGEKYFVDPENFTPPPVLMTPIIATGTSANKYAGGEKRGEKASNRQWSFTIFVKGNSEESVKARVRVLQHFLNRGVRTRDVFVRYRGNTNLPIEVLWGQSAINYRVIHPVVQLGPLYSTGVSREKLIDVGLTLTIGPVADGEDQILANATGGLVLDQPWWEDKVSRGTTVAEATQNHFTNPVFNSFTNPFDNNWTTEANLISSENIDKEFSLFGRSSVKLTSISSVNRSFFETLNVGLGTFELSCHVKLPDGGTVSNTQIALVYGAASITETFTAIGDNGWFRVTGSVAGVAAGTGTGVAVAEGFTVYVDGFQLEEKDYVTPLCHGDLIGCVWDTPADRNDSSSTRTAAQMTISVDDSINIAEGTVRAVWEADIDSTDLGSDRDIFQDTSAGFRLFWRDPQTDWRFTDGTNVAEGAVRAHSTGDVIIFHAVYDPVNGLVLYINGAEYATNATYTPPTLGADLFIGTNPSVASHINGTFKLFNTLPVAITAQQSSDDAANLRAAVDADLPLDPIPWLWTSAGDGVFENCIESGKQNWGVAHGIPGSIEADTTFKITFSTLGAQAFYLSNNDLDEFIDPGEYGFFDVGDVVDANSCGGFYFDAIADGLNAFVNVTIADEVADAWIGKEFLPVIRVYDEGASEINYRLVTTTSDEESFQTVQASWQLLRMPRFQATNAEEVQFVSLGLTLGNFSLLLLPDRTSGGVALLRIDYMVILPKATLVVDDTQSQHGLLVNGSIVTRFSSTDVIAYDLRPLLGDEVHLQPHKYNNIMTLVEDGSTGDPEIDKTATFDSITIKPRYELI